MGDECYFSVDPEERTKSVYHEDIIGIVTDCFDKFKERSDYSDRLNGDEQVAFRDNFLKWYKRRDPFITWVESMEASSGSAEARGTIKNQINRRLVSFMKSMRRTANMRLEEEIKKENPRDRKHDVLVVKRIGTSVVYYTKGEEKEEKEYTNKLARKEGKLHTSCTNFFKVSIDNKTAYFFGKSLLSGAPPEWEKLLKSSRTTIVKVDKPIPRQRMDDLATALLKGNFKSHVGTIFSSEELYHTLYPQPTTKAGLLVHWAITAMLEKKTKKEEKAAEKKQNGFNLI